MRGVRRLPVRRVLELKRRAVEVQPDERYREIGVRSFARGLFLKDSVSGHELGSKRVFYVEPDDLVVSNIFAWEGAVAVASAEHVGTIGSHRFMTWTALGDVDVRYIAHYFASEHGLAQLRNASPGSAGRNRTLSIKNFEAIDIPLPDLPEQRRIAAHLDSVVAASLRMAASELSQAEIAVQRTCARALDSVPTKVPLGSLVEVNPRPQRVQAEDEVLFIPMAAVSDVTGTVVAAEKRLRSDLSSGYKQALPGDMIFARITPCMQNGKSAIVPDWGPAVAYGSTEFHVLRGEPRLLEWLHLVVRSQWFINQAEASFTGTAGQQRVPARFLEEVSVPVPSHLDNAIETTRSFLRLQDEVASLSRQRDVICKALLPAARNDIFNQLR